jgi:dihydrodipicolinate synthase/N-acetylneuraminate lyase
MTPNTLGQKKAELAKRLRLGVTPAMATPLLNSRSINDVGTAALIDFLIDAGVSGLFVGGTTGEGILLSLEERLHLHELSLKAIAGRVPALLHVGSNTSEDSAVLAEHAESIGADAIVAVTPYFYPIHDESLHSYYYDLAVAAPNTLLFAYDIPHLAVNSISPVLFSRLVDSIDSFVGLKTSSPDAQVIRKFIDAAKGKVLVLAGNERIALGSLALGADGLISGLATAIPEPFINLLRFVKAGKLDLARKEQERINWLLDVIPSGARIGAIKAILTARGIPAGLAVPPRPMPHPDWQGWSYMSSALKTD